MSILNGLGISTLNLDTVMVAEAKNETSYLAIWVTLPQKGIKPRAWALSLGSLKKSSCRWSIIYNWNFANP
jgi:hypothetical protein